MLALLQSLPPSSRGEPPVGLGLSLLVLAVGIAMVGFIAVRLWRDARTAGAGDPERSDDDTPETNPP